VEDDEHWTCQACEQVNDESFRFCPNCGAKNTLLETDKLDKSKLLSMKATVNPAPYEPGESRSTGWVLKNETSAPITVRVKLEFVGGANEVQLMAEDHYDIKVASNDDIYILADCQAPACAGLFTTFYQLKMVDTDVCIGPVLELKVDVKPVYSPKKEEKIRDIVQMGFTNREKIVYALNSNGWNVNKALNELL